MTNTNGIGKATELAAYGISADEYRKNRELGLRWCSGCKQFKQSTDFSKRAGLCKPCRKIYQSEWWGKNRDREVAKRKVYYQNNAERLKKYARDRRSSLSRWQLQEMAFRNRLSVRFGIRPSDYDGLLEKQGGGCAVCGAKRNGLRLPVDHDHSCCPGRKSCGKCIRGILCVRCNTITGFLEKNSELVPLCEAYIREHRPSSTS